MTTHKWRDIKKKVIKSPFRRAKIYLQVQWALLRLEVSEFFKR